MDYSCWGKAMMYDPYLNLKLTIVIIGSRWHVILLHAYGRFSLRKTVRFHPRALVGRC